MKNMLVILLAVCAWSAAPVGAQVISMDASEKPVASIGKSARSLPKSFLDGLWETNIQVQVPALNMKQVQAEDLARDAKDKAFRIGVVQDLTSIIAVDGSKSSKGLWHKLSDGSSVWQVTLSAADAYGLRVQLSGISLPDSCAFYVYDTQNPTDLRGPYNNATLAGRTSFWTGSLFTDQVTIECYCPAKVDRASVTFEIGEIIYIYRNPTTIAKEGNCHNDVTCYSDWSSEARAVAGIGSIQERNYVWCTGCLLNDRDTSTYVDYFMTANHCVGTQQEANDAEFYWFYKTSSCNGVPPSLASLPRTDGGADYLAGAPSESGNDFSFLRLRQATPGGVVYAGWTTGTPSGSEILAGVHLPDGSYERISFGHLTDSWPDYWSVTWYSGVTEAGSSGSPLFNSNHRFIGQLWGGNSSCDDPSGVDDYGRFDKSYPSIQQWLNPVENQSGKYYLPGDYNGDRLIDLCVYYPNNGNWLICYNDGWDFSTTFSVNWGWSEAQAVPGDYDGDHVTDVAVYHPESGYWMIRSSLNSNQMMSIYWGWSEALPVPADYDGDGITDCAVYYPQNGAWLVRKSSDQTMLVRYCGFSGASPVPGDYSRSGHASFVVYLRDSGSWIGVDSLTGQSIPELQDKNWGWYGASPIPADYDGDGKTDRAVYFDGSWLVWLSRDAESATWVLGDSDALPVPAHYRSDMVGGARGARRDTRAMVGIYYPESGLWSLKDFYWDQATTEKNFGWSEALPPNL